MLVVLLAGFAIHMNYSDDIVKFILSLNIVFPAFSSLVNYYTEIASTIGAIFLLAFVIGLKKIISYESAKSLTTYGDFVSSAREIAEELEKINKIISENIDCFEKSKVWKKISRRL